ncbi:MAG: type II toxin-antitoxin system prevent-host-death family antitoxin, partial [Acidimicrobiia bacterium]|nr:type II toxin-antitoxin system prevent-host-death family antitoxin [Acidimicrobiia bacterium]
MAVATSRVEVGVRDLKNNLSRYLDRVKEGEEVIVTDRGRP